MSGIVALVSRNGRPAEPAPPARMLDAMAYRGPDGLRLQAWDRAVAGLRQAGGHAPRTRRASSRG